MSHDTNTHRRGLILNMINHLGPISRTELISLTDYRPATVGAIVAQLLEEQLVVETGYHSAGHGRKRVMLEINSRHLCAIGISFSARCVNYIVAQTDGNILHESETPIPASNSKQELAKEIAEHVQTLLSLFSQRCIIGIGICNPLYDPLSYKAAGPVLANYLHFNDWIHEDLSPMLEALGQLTVKSFSGVTMPALAEQRFGVAKGMDHFLWIELTNGIGASIFCNGNVYGGAHGVAGELGHTMINHDSTNQRLCYCGKPGCVESTAAYPALIGAIRKSLADGVFSVLNTYHSDPNQITVQDLRRALEEGDRLCIYHVRNAAQQIGVAIANAVTLLNPQMIVLYGFMLELGDYFLQQLETAIRENVLSLASDFEIRVSNALESIMSLGAVAEIFSDYLKMDDYRWVYQLQNAEPNIKEESL